jgi:formylglycine-generating enzyme required for sulfatase activity
MNVGLVKKLAVELAWGIAAVAGAGLVARAAPGDATSDRLAVVGTLRDASGKPVQGPRTLGFVFNDTAGTSCAAQAAGVAIDPESGSFRADLALGACASEALDGDDVKLDVTVDSQVVVQDRLLAPVPYAKHADSTGSPDCPVGYDKQAAPAGKTFIVCRRVQDQLVKVGMGTSAFWIDRYESSLWTAPGGDGTQQLPVANAYPQTFPRNGQGNNAASTYAASVSGVAPNRWLTWFQANVACRAGGKRLPRSDEWITAALGTPDPASPSSDSATCSTQAAAVRATGGGSACVSRWGAEDMVGNVWEWTTEWYGAFMTSSVSQSSHPWPPGYGDDSTWNFENVGRSENGPVQNIPVASLRGGDHRAGVMAGSFALNLEVAPSGIDDGIGFRCVVDR